MDPLFFGGLVISLLAIVVATVIDGNSFGPLIGPSSAVLVLFGALGAGLMAYRLADLSRLPKILAFALTGSPPDAGSSVTALADIADIARREGMLAVEGKLEEIDDAFMRAGLQHVVDGLDETQVREVLEIDVAALEERHQFGIGFFKSLAGFAPTFGMIGTVIGLINMLQNLSDPDQLGIGMALALLTTLYGVMFANLIFTPIQRRLERLHAMEIAAREVVIDGIVAIQSGMSPRLLVERLEIFLPPGERVGHAARTKGGAAEAA